MRMIFYITLTSLQDTPQIDGLAALGREGRATPTWRPG
jgi:hypothetical protein